MSQHGLKAGGKTPKNAVHGSRKKSNLIEMRKKTTEGFAEILKLDVQHDLTNQMQPYLKFLNQKGDSDQNILHYIIGDVPKFQADDEMSEESFEDCGQSGQLNESLEDALEGFEESDYDQSMPHRRLFEWVVMKCVERLTEPNDSSLTPMQYAISSGRLQVVDWFQKLLLPDKTLKGLEPVSCASLQSKDCSFRLDPVFTEQIQLANHPSDHSSAPSGKNEVCAHKMLATAPGELDKIKSRNETIAKTLVDLMEKSKLLHLLLKDSQVDSNLATFESLVDWCCQEKEEPQEGVHSTQELNPHKPTELNQPLPVKTQPHLYLLEKRDEKGETLLHSAVSRFNQAESAMDPLQNLVRMIELLLEKHPQGIYSLIKNVTPYQVLIMGCMVGTPSPERRSVEEMFKECCIGNIGQKGKTRKTRRQRLDYLYPDKRKERNIEFDLSAVREPITAEWLDHLDFCNIQYETVLEYLRLPPVPSAQKHSSSASVTQSNIFDRQGYSDVYASVFEWLKGKGIWKIFRVRVDDICPRPHGDSFIEAALSGFQLDEFDWRKLDIGSDTIINGAPDVKILNLYWSGSRSVLQGWACEDGLCRLENLEKINLIIYMGNDREEALNQYVESFIQRLTNRKPGLQIFPRRVSLDTEGNNKDHGKGLGGSSGRPQHLWLSEMDGFNLSLDNYTFKDANNKRIVPEVRVALIDDGVSIDHGVEDLNTSRQNGSNNGGRSYRSKYKVAGGTSFYESTLEDSEFRQYFVGPGGHGNTMADFINRVCPNVRLFAIRVNDAGRNTTGARFTVKSCAEAITWAVETCKADIISMSWSFQSDAQAKINPDDVQLFREAIGKAIAQKKILFASLHDQGSTLDYKTFLPMGIQGVIRIGSSTSYGKPSDMNSDGSIEFALPGEKVENHASGKEVTGSSVATAIAAGLGALIIYCADVAKALGIDVRRDPRDMETMRLAFTKMVPAEQPKCPTPYTVFPKVMPLDKGAEKAKEELQRIMINLGF